MPKIKLTDIRINERQRKTIDPEHIEKLAESIRLLGLMHPIVIDNNNTLIAGECRVLAYKRLGRDEIECTRFSDLTTWDILVMELEENLRRQNLTYDEEVRAVKLLHELHQEKHGKVSTLGGKGQYNKWKIEDTATLLGISLGAASQKIQLAIAIEKNPELAKLKSEAQAWNTFQRDRSIKGRQVLAKLITLKQDKDVPKSEQADKIVDFSDSGIDIYNASCLDIIPRLPDSSIHCLLTDPPWQVDFDKHFMSDTSTSMLDLTSSMLEAVKSKLVPGALCWMFCATKHLIRGTIYNMIHNLGYTMFDQIFLWYKPQQAKSSHPFSELKNDYEPVILFANGSPRPFNFPIYAVKSSPVPTQSVHPAQKPDEVLSLLINVSTVENEQLVDPFCGSGRVGVVSKQLNRRAVLIDSDNRWFSAAVVGVKDGNTNDRR